MACFAQKYEDAENMFEDFSSDLVQILERPALARKFELELA